MFLKKLVVIILLGTVIHGNTSACSCSNILNLCFILEEAENPLVFKGKVVDRLNYENDYHSILIEVVREFTDTNILTDTVEILGGSNSAACEKSFGQMQIGKTYYLGIINPQWNIFNIDQFPGFGENNWRYAPNLCNSIILEIRNESVYGQINEKFSLYPVDVFEKRILNCDYRLSDILDYQCNDNKISIRSVRFNRITFENFGAPSQISDISIYTIQGELVYHQKEYDGRSIEFDFGKIPNGILIIEYYCGGIRKAEKIFAYK